MSLRQFDKGVERARKEYADSPQRAAASAFSDVFASFALYDVRASENNAPEASKFVRVYSDGGPQPILWKHLHQPLAKILREDPDIGPYYAGFATLFTVDREVSSEADGNTRYFSMSIDAPLEAPGFQDAFLSRAQFTGKYAEGKPLPLTSVCLNPTRDAHFKSVPIIFHWSDDPAGVGKSLPAGSELLKAWGHVSVNVPIPRTTECPGHGLETNVQKCGFTRSINAVDNGEGFHRQEFLLRLRRFVKEDTAAEDALNNQIAWTVAYFAYACECLAEAENTPVATSVFANQNIQPESKAPLKRLAIVCAPASYDNVASAALYLPLFYPRFDASGDKFARAALKTLYLARALGMPLEHLQEFSSAYKAGVTQTVGVFAHQIKSVASAQTTGWLVDAAQWDAFCNDEGRHHPAIQKLQAELLIAPVPRLFEAGTKAIKVWAQRLPVTDFFEENQHPETLEELLRAAWRISDDIFFAVVNRRTDFRKRSESILEVYEQSLKYTTIEPEIEISPVGVGLWWPPYTADRIDSDAKLANERLRQLSNFFQLVIALFDEALNWGVRTKPAKASMHITAEECSLTLSNERSLAPTVGSSAFLPGRKGRDVLQELVVQLNGSISFSDPGSVLYGVSIHLPRLVFLRL